MIGQSQIIIGTEQQHIVAVARNARRLPTADQPGTPQQPPASDLIKLVLNCSLHNWHSHWLTILEYTVDNGLKKNRHPDGNTIGRSSTRLLPTVQPPFLHPGSAHGHTQEWHPA